MLQKLKKIFSSLKKKTFFFVLTISVLFFPLYSAYSAEAVKFKLRYLIPLYWYVKGASALMGWDTKMLDIGLGRFLAIVLTTILQIPLFVANVFLSAAAALLSIVTSPTFIDLPYTKLGNPIIRMGWTITRDLANMGIVLALIVIGIATILRIESYRAKKTLPILIIIALLINFTPVLLGLIVDASNILMHFFLGNCLETSGFVNLVKGQWEIITTSWAEASKADTVAGIFAPLGETIALTFFGFIAGFIFITFAFLFVLRYVAIWILVILSPLAFVFYILPATKEYFSKWWNQFIQWCLVGVVAAFFLYLSNGLLALATGQGLFGVKELPMTKFGEVGGSGPATTGLSGLLNALLPYYVIVGFLILGLIATSSISAMGASTVVNWSKRGQKASAKWIGGATWRGVKQHIEPPIKRAVGGITKGVETVPFARWFLPEKFRRYGEFRPAIDEEEKRLEGVSPKGIAHRIAHKADVGIRATAGMRILAKEGNMQDLIEASMKVYKAENEEELFKNEKFKKEIATPLKMAFRGGRHNALVRGDPRLAAIVAGKKWAGPYKEMSEEEAITRATNEARRPQVANWEREVLENKTVVKALMGRGREIHEAINTQVKMGQETMLKTVDELFSEYIRDILVKDKEMSVVAKDAKQGAPRATAEALDKFKKHYEATHQGKKGYFTYIEGQRAKEIGWRTPKYVAPGEEKKPPTPSPVRATGMGPKPEEERTKPLTVGEALKERKKRKKEE